ncbi:phytanoyl-CoA dioxygenase family protein [uncultured Oxalicibacterium sp.]|uniref:phytanoyl-CoA dioxygenase family protein n=1 Tax=uncultured Oxalicibacterium sp. TaxID=1168540 RepID=UPI0025F32985|nr:phytanoyl-CoA dioxygenase family protein [uncultured Oxalicibacterium sp.]
MSTYPAATPAAALSAEEIARFERDGFLVFRAMLDPAACTHMLEVASRQLQQAVPPLEYEAELGYEGAPASLEAEGGKTVRRLRGAYDRDDCFREWAEDPRIVDKVRQLVNEPVCLTLAHHNCVMTKHPRYGTATGWHRDIRYWSFTHPDLVCVWLALGEETSANGGLRFIPGSHRLAIPREQLDDLLFLRPDHPANAKLFAQGVPVQLQQGDVVFFHSHLFHAAGVNTSNVVKTSVAFVYHGCSNQPVAGTRSAALADIRLSD